MIDLNVRLQPRSDNITAGIMDGEAILINLSTGVYYSMDSTGAVIWELVERQQSIGEIVAALSARFDTSGHQVLADVERIIGQLLEEQLVEHFSGTPGGTQKQREESTLDSRVSYTAPVLNIYRDMGDLLALDPPMPGLRDIPWKNAQ